VERLLREVRGYAIPGGSEEVSFIFYFWSVFYYFSSFPSLSFLKLSNVNASSITVCLSKVVFRNFRFRIHPYLFIFLIFYSNTCFLVSTWFYLKYLMHADIA
jgi:hypothetical protein